MPATASIERPDAPWIPSPSRDASSAGDAADRLLTHGTLIQAAARDSLVPERQRRLGQYFTPMWVARLLASMIPSRPEPMRVLDPGAGAGTLFTALAARLLRQGQPPSALTVTAFEIDTGFRPFLERSADAVGNAYRARSIPCQVNLRFEDFAERTSLEALGHLFSEPEAFDAAILNPPYRRLSSKSDLRARLDALEIAAPNLYAAFLGLALRVVRPGGTVVAIVPRSFCNGTYFARFRRYLLSAASVRHVHLFARRKHLGRMPSSRRTWSWRCGAEANGETSYPFRSATAPRIPPGAGEPGSPMSCAGMMPICSYTFQRATGA